MESILTSVKKMLGLDETITNFDEELIMHINTALSILSQFSSVNYLIVTGYNETWSDLIEDMNKLQLVKTYVYLKVRMIFDPPTGTVNENFNNQISELEWRINTITDNTEN